jgi:hypothetical protein
MTMKKLSIIDFEKIVLISKIGSLNYNEIKVIWE